MGSASMKNKREVVSEEGSPAGLSSCSGGLRPLGELYVEPAGLCGRCTGVAVPLRKGLYLIDRVPDELWNEVRDIVQETGIKTIPMEKKCKKAK